MVEIQPAAPITTRPDASGEDCDNGVTIERREKYSAVCKWRIEQFSTKLKRTTRCLYSKYFEVGGFDCRLLVYPAGELFLHFGWGIALQAICWDRHRDETHYMSFEYSIKECRAVRVPR